MFAFLALGGKSVARATQKCKQEDFIDFLTEIRAINPEVLLIIILDNARIHKAKSVKDFCAVNSIILVYLPPYSPNLNPIEFVWKDVKKKLSQFYQTIGEEMKVKGEEITRQFLESRQDSYTKQWRESFL